MGNMGSSVRRVAGDAKAVKPGLRVPEDRFLPVLRYENHMIFAVPCGMVQVMLLRHEDLLVGLAVPLGDLSQLLTLMFNCR
jgi:hypothetical protein